MLTPTFTLSQSEEFIILSCKCPFLKTQEIDISIQNQNIKLLAKPYFLNLTLNNKLVEESENNCTTYDISTGLLTCKIEKFHKIHFEDLDLLTNLLVKKDKNLPFKPMIQVIEPTSADSTSLDDELDDAEGVLDIENLDSSTNESRIEFKCKMENLKFNDDHYISDFVNDGDIKELIKYKTDFQKMLKIKQEDPSKFEFTFDQNENNMMMNLNNRDYIVDHPKILYLGVVDILFSYCYNKRINEGDSNVESSWNLVKLSSTLCCFQTFETVRDVALSFYRRSLTYPLYRNYELCSKIQKDVVILLKLGKKPILRAFLEIKNIFAGDEVFSFVNRLWIDDYCCWLQKSKNKFYFELGSELNHLKIEKSDMKEFQLEELEELARESLDENGNPESSMQE
ncbi:Hsp90 cochaperone shq1 [Clydaea vesicula]|uniref:Hsp90 cochaperone shq1 n=1 Tax=Clydaea vesicula TaxID=447962 RepID=A0AAD5XZH4_9FUNG|nr:Hsp90 cochaperone shq1 [Clydaea vesicula]